jgi:cell division protein FtsA
MVFALDIGTRKVAGILGEIRDGKVCIIDAVVREHESRAMLDGQIHNIEEVSNIVSRIKKELEARNNITISRVTTALAGRNLHTEIAEAAMEKKGEITREDLSYIELESVRAAHAAIIEKKKTDYYCVGFSPVFYMIDGQTIKNPMQQTAKEKFYIKTIVTFLPKIVFDSLLGVLKNCSLEIEAITLEPIAALYVTIPEDMRLLNLALVDVGAGTSDIAITDKDRITAYGMIPKAGDEITEEICGRFLVDFKNGEKIKRFIDKEWGIETEDIFNNKIFVAYEDFKKAISEKTEELAREIADGIFNLNLKQPQAVIMVGGGSGLEILREKVAENLGLPAARVGSRLPRNILNITNLPDSLAGTEGITPLGILETALYKKGLGFVDVEVNGEKTYIINLESKIKVIDAVIARGIELKNLYGKPGSAITFTFNSDIKILRGGKGEHSKIYINGTEKELEDEIKKGDKIEITGTKDGEDAAATIRAIIPEEYFTTIEINGKITEIYPQAFLAGREISLNEPVIDRAEISVKKTETVKEALLKCGFAAKDTNERDIIITIGGEPVVLKQKSYQLKVNGMDVSMEYKIRNMDKVEFKNIPAYYRIRDVLKYSAKKKIEVFINGKPYGIESEDFEIYMNGKKVSEDEFLINGANIETKVKDEKILLSSIFRYYPIDRDQMKGKMLELRVNGEKAGYTTLINNGAQIEINFV